MIQRKITNTDGFTMIEMIVIVVIMMVMGAGSYLTYNSVIQNIDLERAQEIVFNAFDNNKLIVINGQALCSELELEKERGYATIIEYNDPVCEKFPLLRGVSIDEKKELTLDFDEDFPHEIEIESYDKQGNKKFTTVPEGEHIAKLDVSRSIDYQFNIFSTKDKKETFQKLKILYLSENNINVERVDHIVISQVNAINFSNQDLEGGKLKVLLKYPEATPKFYLDNRWVKSGSVTLSKKMTTLDPTKVTLADVFGGGGTFNSEKEVNFN